MIVFVVRFFMGKIIFVVNIVINVIRDGYLVLYIDIEMLFFVIMNKIMVRGGVVIYEDFLKGRLIDE